MNALYLVINNSGMAPAEFTPTAPSTNIEKIIHTPSNCFFTIVIPSSTTATILCQYAPGEALTRDSKHLGSWDATLVLFSQWLTYLEREISQPDLWATLAQIDIPDTLPDDNSPFTEPERRAIEERIGQIRDYAHRVLPVLEDQPEWGRRLEAKLDYLTESSERVGRKDWLSSSSGRWSANSSLA